MGEPTGRGPSRNKKVRAMDVTFIRRFSCLIFLINLDEVTGTTFTFINHCEYTVWPGVLTGAGSSKVEITGFELANEESRSIPAPTDWSGRFWGRTGCNFDGSGNGSCATGDCGTGAVECNGSGAVPPATLAEFTLSSIGKDFYDVSLVDGYNLPMYVTAKGGNGDCQSTGCVQDLNRRCPQELKADGGVACKSACEAFASPEYCCNGQYGSPATCSPSVYSQIFKSACPKSYSYAYDDATSTFTCSGADYVINFCPEESSSQKTARVPEQVGSSVAGSSLETRDQAGTSPQTTQVTGSGTRNGESGSVSGTGGQAGSTAGTQGTGAAVMFTDVVGYATAKASQQGSHQAEVSLIFTISGVISVLLL